MDRDVGLNVTVPPDVLDKVTVRVASFAMACPPKSCRCTVIVTDATPAVVVTADVVNASFPTGPTPVVTVKTPVDAKWVLSFMFAEELLEPMCLRLGSRQRK